MTRRKDGLWQQQMTVMDHGVKKQKFFYGKTKQEVLKKIAEYREEKALGAIFENVADEWWAEAEPSLSFNSTKNYKPAYVRAKERFGASRIAQIRPADINRFVKDFVREKHAADKTARTQLMVVNLIFKYAVANGYCDLNPARDLTVPKDLPKSKRDMPSDDDIARVKGATGCTFGLFAYWALYTGMRRGELLALDWSDVDIKDRTIRVSKSIYFNGNRPIVKAPKTESGIRTVPLMARLEEKIKPQKGPVFPGPDGKYMTSSFFDDQWKKYCEESGVSCTPHQLRHAYATMLFENDISESDAQELLGHAQISTTKDIYTHIRETRKKTVRDKLLNVDIS